MTGVVSRKAERETKATAGAKTTRPDTCQFSHSTMDGIWVMAFPRADKSRLTGCCVMTGVKEDEQWQQERNILTEIYRRTAIMIINLYLNIPGVVS